VNSKQNVTLQQKHCNQTHHSSVIIIIIITITANHVHCLLFNVYQTVTACYCAKREGCSHCRRTNSEIVNK